MPHIAPCLSTEQRIPGGKAERLPAGLFPLGFLLHILLKGKKIQKRRFEGKELMGEIGEGVLYQEGLRSMGY